MIGGSYVSAPSLPLQSLSPSPPPLLSIVSVSLHNHSVHLISQLDLRPSLLLLLSMPPIDTLSIYSLSIVFSRSSLPISLLFFQSPQWMNRKEGTRKMNGMPTEEKTLIVLISLSHTYLREGMTPSTETEREMELMGIYRDGAFSLYSEGVSRYLWEIPTTDK